LRGYEGDDYLDGGIGADPMIGGMGNDGYVVEDVSDSLAENADEGIDLVNAQISFVLADHFEKLTLLGQSAIDGTGNNLELMALAMA
jgi:trimeric autotransporter adhesin